MISSKLSMIKTCFWIEVNENRDLSEKPHLTLFFFLLSFSFVKDKRLKEFFIICHRLPNVAVLATFYILLLMLIL